MEEPRRPNVAVLIVEDEPLIRLAAVYQIEDAGFEVYEAGSADAAIALLEVHKEICLILRMSTCRARWTGLNSHTMFADGGHL